MLALHKSEWYIIYNNKDSTTKTRKGGVGMKNMTIAEYKEKIEQAIEKYDEINGNGDYYYVGVRYEDKPRQVGEECECSKHNAGDREFPEYGTVEYDELDDLGGTSAWSAHKYLSNYDLSGDQSQLVSNKFKHVAHAYIIVGQYANTPSDADDGEIVIEDAVVTEVLF